MIGAATLDPLTYEEVEADRAATPQAFTVVLLSSLAMGIGARGLGSRGSESLIFIAIMAILGWAAWALLTFEIGARLLPEPQTRVSVGELLRTLGFSATPGLLSVAGIIPGLTIPVFVLTAGWMLMTMIVAVRQALDYTSIARAVLVCALGWILSIVWLLLFGLWFGPVAS
jgi:hypothetical protein